MNYEISSDLFWKILKFLAKLCASDEAYIREIAIEIIIEIILKIPE
jgi:hypothetical protein